MSWTMTALTDSRHPQEYPLPKWARENEPDLAADTDAEDDEDFLSPVWDQFSILAAAVVAVFVIVIAALVWIM